jgi:DNA-binding NtrC family response regulator
MASILIIEDEHALGNALSLATRRLGHLPTLAPTGLAALDLISKKSFDAIVLDIGLPDINGLEVLTRIRNSGSKIPVVIITAHATLDHAILSQKLGIADYLIKPLDLGRFEDAIASIVSKGSIISEPSTQTSITLIGAAPRMHHVFLGIARACSGRMPVMIYGASGTGKSLAARVIHTNGSPHHSHLRMIECSSIQHASTLQTILADTQGTLVLEDLTSLDISLQNELASHINQHSDHGPRIIATVINDPRLAVDELRLRADLFYAFSALNIEIPPLKERTEDIPALSRFLRAVQNEASHTIEITAPALAAMQTYEWPGNIRELKYVLDHAHAMSQGGPLFPGHLPPHVAASISPTATPTVSGELNAAISRWIDTQMELMPPDSWQYDEWTEQIESALLKHLLDKFEQKPTRLAAALRINRSTLRQKLKRAGIMHDA